MSLITLITFLLLLPAGWFTTRCITQSWHYRSRALFVLGIIGMLYIARLLALIYNWAIIASITGLSSLPLILIYFVCFHGELQQKQIRLRDVLMVPLRKL